MSKARSLCAGDVYRDQRENLDLVWVSGQGGADRPLELPGARWVGMALVGYLNIIHANRVQVIGPQELDYLADLDATHERSTRRRIFKEERTALIIITDGAEAPAELRALSDEFNMPLLTSSLPAPRLIHNLQYYLAYQLAPCTTVHGVLLSVMGHGILITGESGIGKSELALELVSLGHHLIADDAVEIFRVAPDRLEGRADERFRHFLEVRGLGILNIAEMFGEAATRLNKDVELIVHLQRMDAARLNGLDRLQQERQYSEILGVQVPRVTIPVVTGRNLSVLVEAAARNQILSRRGLDAVEEFIDRQQAAIESPGDND